MRAALKDGSHAPSFSEVAVGMILDLTEIEKIVLLGLLEDIAQAEDVNEACPIQTRVAIKGIIQKLGGTYFGIMVT